MKRTLSVFLAVVMIACFSGIAAAGNTTVTAGAAAQVTGPQLSIDSHDKNTTVNPRQFTTLIPMPLPNSLPPVYADHGWKIWDNPFYSQNAVTIQMMKAMRNPWLHTDVRNWCTMADKFAKAPVQVLTKMPAKSLFAPQKNGAVQWKIMGTVTVKGNIVAEKGIEGAIFEGLYKAKQDMNATRVLILLHDRLETVGHVMALGTVVGGNAIFSNNGSPDGAIAGAVGGSGWGHTRSYIETRELVKIIVFN
jgi:hypothetical protein